MNELLPITKQEPGMVLLENYDEVKAYLTSQLEQYKTVEYSEDNVKDAKNDRASLRKVKKAIADKRKEIKAIYMEPFLTVEEKLKELESLVEEPIVLIDGFVKDAESKIKLTKKSEIKSYFDAHASALGELSDALFESKGFFDEKWLNASTKASVWQAEIIEKISVASANLHTIQVTGGVYTPILITKYLETQSIEETKEYHKKLRETEQVSDVAVIEDGNNVIGYKVLKINATESQMAQLLNQLDMLGIDYEELEDGMPVGDVAFDVGYNTLSSFNRHFLKEYGMSPTQWKKTAKE